MDFFADYHMHTKHSDGRATVDEMAGAAKVKGLSEIAITDHGPNNISVGVKNLDEYIVIKKETREASKNLGINVFCGAEANITGTNGEIDIPKDIYKELDLLLVGLHPYVYPNNVLSAVNFVAMNILSNNLTSARNKVINTNTKTLKEAMYKNDIDIITHPGLGLAIDIKEIAKTCAETKTAYEINVGHEFQTAAEIVVAAKEGAKFVVNSDSHFPESVGNLEYGMNLLKQAKVPKEQVLNINKEFNQLN